MYVCVYVCVCVWALPYFLALQDTPEFISCPSLRIRHLCKDLWFLLLENSIGNQKLGSRSSHCYWDRIVLHPEGLSLAQTFFWGDKVVVWLKRLWTWSCYLGHGDALVHVTVCLNASNPLHLWASVSSVMYSMGILVSCPPHLQSFNKDPESSYYLKMFRELEVPIHRFLKFSS